MKRSRTGRLSLLVVLAALLLALTNTYARQNSVFEQLGLLVDVRHELIEGYVEEPDQQAMGRAAIDGMIESLEDPYTAFIPPEEQADFDKIVRGTFSGIGALIGVDNDRLTIVTPLEDSPAWKAGVMAGDVILEIQGEPAADMRPPEAVKLLTGEEGTDVTIKVLHESGEEQLVTITRAVINIRTVRGFRREADQHFGYMLDDANKVGYIRIIQFTDSTAGELRGAIDSLKLAGMRGLILDLRFDPGGLLESAVEVSDMFLTEGKTIVSVKGRVVPEQTQKSTSDTLLPDTPVVVLASGGSASAAEIVTGALKDNDRALFVGTRTFGKGSVQTLRELESGNGWLKITNAYFYLPSGRLIHRKPDAEDWGVDPSEGAWVSMTAEQIEKMMDVRRETDVVREDNGHQSPDETAVTPDYLEQQFADLQLAAALRAVMGKIETGEWPRVGEDVSEQLVRTTTRQNLIRVRDALSERLQEVEQELEELDEEKEPQTDNVALNADEADAEQDAEVDQEIQKIKQQIEEATAELDAIAKEAQDTNDAAKAAADGEADMVETEPADEASPEPQSQPVEVEVDEVEVEVDEPLPVDEPAGAPTPQPVETP